MQPVLKMNTGKSRRRSIRSMLEENDSESDEEDNDSRPAERQQFAAGCSRLQHKETMVTGRSILISTPMARAVAMESSAGVGAGMDAVDKSDGDINVEFSMQKDRIKRATINKLKVAEIRRCLIERGLDSKGKKTELKRHLAAALKNEATAVGHKRKGGNMGKGRRRSIRSMLEEDDIESDEKESDSRPVKRQQVAAGCSRL